MKKTVSIFILMVLICGLVGCKNSNPSPSPSNPTGATKTPSEAPSVEPSTEPTTDAPITTDTPTTEVTVTPTDEPSVTTDEITPEPTKIVTPETVDLTPTGAPSNTPTPTKAPTPSNTPKPSNTPTPTNTPKPNTPTPTEKPKYTYTDMNATMYTTQSVNVRDIPDASGKKLASLVANTEVKVTGKCKEANWYRINIDGKEGFVSGNYLTDKKATPTPTSTPKPVNTPTNTPKPNAPTATNTPTPKPNSGSVPTGTTIKIPSTAQETGKEVKGAGATYDITTVLTKESTAVDANGDKGVWMYYTGPDMKVTVTRYETGGRYVILSTDGEHYFPFYGFSSLTSEQLDNFKASNWSIACPYEDSVKGQDSYIKKRIAETRPDLTFVDTTSETFNKDIVYKMERMVVGKEGWSRDKYADIIEILNEKYGKGNWEGVCNSGVPEKGWEKNFNNSILTKSSSERELEDPSKTEYDWITNTEFTKYTFIKFYGVGSTGSVYRLIVFYK